MFEKYVSDGPGSTSIGLTFALTMRRCALDLRSARSWSVIAGGSWLFIDWSCAIAGCWTCCGVSGLSVRAAVVIAAEWKNSRRSMRVLSGVLGCRESMGVLW